MEAPGGPAGQDGTPDWVTYLNFGGLMLLCVSLPATSAWSHLGCDFAGSQFPVACLQLLSLTLQETL